MIEKKLYYEIIILHREIMEHFNYVCYYTTVIIVLIRCTFTFYAHLQLIFLKFIFYNWRRRRKNHGIFKEANVIYICSMEEE